jgi:phosphoribosyl-ATP pyrophosphohydrolase/phosphoribosyl-AMP cyclohydrolase
VFFAGDSAGHCFPLSGEGIRTAFYFGIACGRELRAVLAGERTARRRWPRYGAFSAPHARAFRARAALQRLIPRLPPRALHRAARRAWAASAVAGARSRGTSTRPHPAFAATIRAPWNVAYDERGLVPCVIQDWRSGEVLTLAYMNAEALARTRETGELHLWSRSRGELWHKGATSGNTQAVKALRYDCDATPCSRSSSPPARPATPASARASTTATSSRRAARGRCPGSSGRSPRAPRAPEGSYTARCSPTRRDRREGQEEAEEVVRAAREESDERVAEEAADVLYHLAVLLRSRGLSLADAEEVLIGRRR